VSGFPSGSTGFSTRRLPRICDRRCPGPPDRGSPAPLTSNREGAALDWPKARKAPDLATTRLEPPPSNEAAPPDATHRGQPLVTLGATARGSLDPGSCSRIALDSTGRKIQSSPSLAKAGEAGCSPDHRHLGPLNPPSLARRRRTGTWRTDPRQGSSCCVRRATRGVRSRFTPLPSAENAVGQGALPGRSLDQGPSQDRVEHVPRVTRDTRESVEALAASSSAASTDASRESNDPQGARVRGSVADVDKTHLPPGAWPAARQATPLRVTFCGGLFGDDEGPIRSGR